MNKLGREPIKYFDFVFIVQRHNSAALGELRSKLHAIVYPGAVVVVVGVCRRLVVHLWWNPCLDHALVVVRCFKPLVWCFQPMRDGLLICFEK